VLSIFISSAWIPAVWIIVADTLDHFSVPFCSLCSFFGSTFKHSLERLFLRPALFKQLVGFRGADHEFHRNPFDRFCVYFRSCAVRNVASRDPAGAALSVTICLQSPILPR
jgi:hypothetical protein